MEAPPTNPLDGAILKLPGKLDRLLLRHGCALPKRVADEIPLVKHDLEEIIAISSNLLEDERAMMVRCWRKEVRELSYDMEDFVDQYEHAAAVPYTRFLHGRKITRRRKGKTTLPYWVRGKLKQRLWMSNKIREFSTRAQEILQRHKLYNLDDDIAGSSSNRCTNAYSTSLRSTPYGEENAYVGIDTALNDLKELLKHDEVQQKCKVVSIVGFRGIGKTTLAMELYHKLGQQFECRAFVRTSQKPDTRRIFISMLSQVRPYQPPDNWTVHSLISTIRTHLQDKRYLIIVEDLCATSTWDIVKRTLPDNNCCSRILTTTEFEDLALQSCDHDPKHVYKMKPLAEDDSRKLFFSSVFGPQEECPPELREISHDIIRKCGGLPLAILIVASILSSQSGIQDRWDYVNKAIGYNLSTNPTCEGMKRVLDLSYNNLPKHLKACILYTGLYEEDIIIWKDDLVNQWIAEGFIQATEGQDKKEIARSFFDRLISGKLILPVDINKNGEVLSCTVQHMVLNLVIRSKSIEENFVTAIHHSQASTTLADKVRRLSLQFGNAEDAIPPTNMRLSHVRTLAFWGVFKCLPSVVQFRLLQVLILHFWGDKDSITFDITRISELFRLKYLKVTSNVTLELHNKMRGLQSLETLTIDARVSAVPSDIVHLPGLLHLSLPAETKLPNGIGLMTSLRSLGYFDLSRNSIDNVQSLRMLTNLRDLQLTCSTVEPENRNSKMQFLLTSILGRLSNLKSLTVVPRASSYAKSINEVDATGMAISGHFRSLPSAPALLQSLEVSPRLCIFFYTPKWIGQLRKLCILKFGVRKINNDGVDVLRGLPHLAVLSLYVETEPAYRMVIGNTGFSVIKYFKFKCCDPFLEFEKGAMPNLRRLKLAFNAHPYSTVPFGIEYLSELREVSVKIGGADPEESYRRAAESAIRDAIRMHAKCHSLNGQCIQLIIANDTDDIITRTTATLEDMPATSASASNCGEAGSSVWGPLESTGSGAGAGAGASVVTDATDPDSEADSVCKLPWSLYRGVVPQPGGRWHAQIYERHQRVWLGTFTGEADAARAYDIAAQRFRGRDVVTNIRPLADDAYPDAAAELHFLESRSDVEVVNMLRNHTYFESLAHNKRAFVAATSGPTTTALTNKNSCSPSRSPSPAADLPALASRRNRVQTSPLLFFDAQERTTPTTKFRRVEPKQERASAVGLNTHIRLLFLNGLKPTIYTDADVTSEHGEAIRLAMFEGDKLVKSGPLSEVEVEILVLHGDFSNKCRDDNWTEDDFDNHILKGRDGQDLVLETARLTNGKVQFSEIRFNEVWENVIMAARVCKSEKTSARVQEAVMMPMTVLNPVYRSIEKRHPPRLDDGIYLLEQISRYGVHCRRLHEAEIYTVEDFLKALNEDADELCAILKMEKHQTSWSKLTAHARECVLGDRQEVKRYQSEDGNVVLFFNCVHELIGAAFPHEYVACARFDPAQKALADKWKRHAYDKLKSIPESTCLIPPEDLPDKTLRNKPKNLHSPGFL